MRDGRVNGFETKLRQCARVHNVKEAIATIREAGGEFITWEVQGYHLDLDPRVQPDKEGNLFTGATDFHHPALRMDNGSQICIRAWGLAPDTPPWAKLAFLKKDRILVVSQDAALEDQRLVDPLAAGPVAPGLPALSADTT